MSNIVSKFLIAGLIITFSSCKQYVVEAPVFGVSTPSSSFGAGEPVSFTIEGNPDFIIFFSGEAGKIYEPGNRGTGISVKGMDTRVGSYFFTYNTPGQYVASFLAATDNVYGKKEAAIQINLTITP